MRAVYWEWRPFRDPDRFWDWAMDPHADLDHDTDLDLHDVRFLDRLVAAADRADCPHGEECCHILEDFTPRLAVHGSPTDVVALRAAIARAADGALPRVRRWAAYATRLLSYREPVGRVNRALAEQMAADLLSRPGRPPAALLVETAANGRLWLCRAHTRFLYVSRRTGAWRLAAHSPLSDTDLRDLR
jgi:hypothetical protein